MRGGETRVARHDVKLRELTLFSIEMILLFGGREDNGARMGDNGDWWAVTMAQLSSDVSVLTSLCCWGDTGRSGRSPGHRARAWRSHAGHTGDLASQGDTSTCRQWSIVEKKEKAGAHLPSTGSQLAPFSQRQCC